MTKRLKITSEIYGENGIQSSKDSDGKTISLFGFFYPIESDNDISTETIQIDSDGDLEVKRRKRGSIRIEHLDSTELPLVGLQVWRGALILSDFLFHHRHEFANQSILEVGSGVGLSSIAAGIFAKKRIVCTDLNIGGILDLIRNNIKRNSSLISKDGKIDVMEFDFKATEWSAVLREMVSQTDVVIAADVIYDNDLTEAFVHTIDKILDPNDVNANGKKIIYIAMEKRYVFTVADLDTVAPCFEYFLICVNQEVRKGKRWKLEFIPIDFPQYFEYERIKELVLMKIHLEM